MEKCWDSDPFKRPTILDLENIISQWLRCVTKHYILNNNKKNNKQVNDIDSQSRSDMYEFVRADEVLTQEQINNFITQHHPQAYYTSRLLNEILDQKTSECLDCIIED
ncbi:hypothetical protein C1645_827182 [Glomus cerebriforme]|uniref:Serine-threonine/tyrosine-protein kinase catalytic domain-containing protein n=1 Tax=Glomus cerebriforme TaxID=658196 RepID=A0A397STE7_9GLOM|nr:hypothetical protein C1645_827182 [Glomus cerebriforme]